MSDSLHRKRGMLADGWQEMTSAPRDGTVVEIACLYGVAPWYRLHQWISHRRIIEADGRVWECDSEPAWVSAGDHRSSVGGVGGERYLLWRPTEQTPAAYVDPTQGAQESSDYWIRACGLNPADYPNRPNPAPSRSWWQRLFA